MINQTSSKYISGLDGLRFFAALSVFGVHYNQIMRLDYDIGPFDLYRFLANGNHGVAFFFVLSGFLLSLPFFNTILFGEPLPRYKFYLMKRAARIIPAYYVALLFFFVFNGYWSVEGAFHDILLHFTFLFNCVEFSIFSMNPPFWSLAVEAQFYLLLPAFFILFRQKSALKSVLGVSITCILSYMIQVYFTKSLTKTIPWPFIPELSWLRPYGAVLNHSIVANLPVFSVGIMGGYVFVRLKKICVAPKKSVVSLCELLFWLVFSAVVITLGTGHEATFQVPYGQYGFPFIPVLMIFVILLLPYTYFAKNCLEWYPIRKLGIISYGIYIYHYPVLNSVDMFMSKIGVDVTIHPVLFAIGGFLLTILAASVSYKIIETPAINFISKRMAN